MTVNPGTRGGRPGTAYYLNENHASSHRPREGARLVAVEGYSIRPDKTKSRGIAKTWNGAGDSRGVKNWQRRPAAYVSILSRTRLQHPHRSVKHKIPTRLRNERGCGRTECPTRIGHMNDPSGLSARSEQVQDRTKKKGATPSPNAVAGAKRRGHESVDDMIDTTSHSNTQATDSVPVDRPYLSSPTRPVVAEHLRFRAGRLSQAIPSIERIVAFRRRCGDAIPESIWPDYASAMVELAAIRGELGVLDELRVERLAETMACPLAVARSLWNEKKTLAEGHAAEQHARAAHKLSHTGAAKVWHVQLVDLMGVSVAFDLRDSDKRGILPKGPTGLPSVKGPTRWAFPREKVPYTANQRKDWCQRLGFKADTLSKNARTLSAEEFHARIAKREAELLPPHRLEGRKEPNESDWHASIRISAEAPKTRNRAFCVTAARREYAKAFGCSKRTAITRTTGLDAAQVVALVEQKLSPQRQICTDSVVPLCTDMAALDLPFSANGCTDHAPVTSPANARFSGRLDPEGIEVVRHWYETTKGRPLSRDNLKKMRKRGSLERTFVTACEWTAEHGTDDDLKRIAEAWIVTFRKVERERRQAKRHLKAVQPGPLSELTTTTALIEAA